MKWQALTTFSFGAIAVVVMWVTIMRNGKKVSATDLGMFGVVCASACAGVWMAYGAAMSIYHENHNPDFTETHMALAGIMGVVLALGSATKMHKMWKSARTAKSQAVHEEAENE